MNSFRWFLRSFLFTFLPLALLLLPLFFHTSASPQIGTYSLAYFRLLAVISGSALAVSVAVSLLCVWRASLRPAYVVVSLLFGLVIAVALVETFLRFTPANDAFAWYRSWGQQRALFYGYEQAPNHTFRLAGATCSTDRHGFRTHLRDVNWERAPGQRLFVMGGSSAFGYSLEDNETWPHLLEGWLREDSNHATVQVINAGNLGHNSTQCLLRFYLRILHHKPDYLLFYESLNDVDPGERSPTSIWITENVLFSETMSSYLNRSYADKTWYSRTLLAYNINKEIRRPAVAEATGQRRKP